LPDDQKDLARPVNESTTPAIARLLEAERKADEGIAKAQAEAEEIVAAAKRRAQQIRGTASSTDGRDSEASRAQEELEKQKRVVLQEGKRHMESMRAAAVPRLSEAVEKLFALLIGES
jgi:V/A-type H+/Na+-transporting ATPase subunit G/H